ncbi:MAG TPA: hypothetical protein VGY55_08035 [Pirellulales bacterium]|jgi:hypothetical protein|nr:hypothetical protein [Pirellulales bacterium]
MARDIDYAATAVKKAIVEKFGRNENLEALYVLAGEKTIAVRDDQHAAEGTRDALLAGIRDANSYAELWERWRHP